MEVATFALATLDIFYKHDGMKLFIHSQTYLSIPGLRLIHVSKMGPICPDHMLWITSSVNFLSSSLGPGPDSKVQGPTWDPPGSCRPQMDPMLAQWTLLSGVVWFSNNLQSINHGKICYQIVCIHPKSRVDSTHKERKSPVTITST